MVLKCAQCETACPTALAMKLHLMRVHDVGEGTLRCCGKQFGSCQGFWRHLSVSHEVETIVDRRQKDQPRRNLKKTLRAFHGSLSRRCFYCAICLKCFVRKSGVTKHRLVHYDSMQRFHCKQCSMVFKLNGDLTQHIMHVHSAARPFKCQKCDATFKTRHHLRRHQAVHSTNKPFKCAVCLVAFKSSFELHRHCQAVHYQPDLKPFGCAHCLASFMLRSSLLKHLPVHADARPFTCGLCRRTFKYAESQRLHQRTFHRAGLPCFNCAKCCASFNAKGPLLQHILNVHADKPRHHCGHCSAAYRSAGGLQRHLRSIKNFFVCAHCAAAFAKKATLRRHLLEK